MSLQFDPEFVADQVVILEAGLQKVGERFLETSQKIGLLDSVLSDKNAQLRSKTDSKLKNSPQKCKISLKMFPQKTGT